MSETTECDQTKRPTVAASGATEELKTMAALADAMAKFDGSNSTVDSKTIHRIVKWFCSRYGGQSHE